MSDADSRLLYDKEDEAIVAAHHWFVSTKRNCSYMICSLTSNARQHNIYLHNEIMKPPKGFEVDHINGNGLDNRRINLRIVTHAENCVNHRGLPGKSGYRGVRASGKKWVARMRRFGKYIHLGTFETPEQAHEAWLTAAKKYPVVPALEWVHPAVATRD